MTRVWFENVSLSDARALASWWNGHTPQRYVVAPYDLPGRYNVLRYEA